MGRRSRLSPEAYFEGLIAGDRTILSRAITLVESTLADDQRLAATVLDMCLHHRLQNEPDTLRLGITGPPGVGKSTFIESFGLMLTRQEQQVAVLAVDPSSQRTGGSILGDKTRMNVLSAEPRAFIRPSPSGQSLGGVGRSTREAILLCETAGFNIIIVETVGVGQSETLVSKMVDYFLLLLLPGAGDDLQGIKRGIMEMANGIVINKADGTLLPVARQAFRDVEQSLRLLPPTEAGVKTQLFLCSSLSGDGIDAVWQQIRAYKAAGEQAGWWFRHRQQQQANWFRQSAEERLLQHLYEAKNLKNKLLLLEDEVFRGVRSLSSALLYIEELFGTTL